MRHFMKRNWLPAAVIVILALVGIFYVTRGGGQEGRAVETAALTNNRTVIIDAGHGGADGGAVSLSGVNESVINLDIATRLDLILGFFGENVVMTRTTEELEYSKTSDSIHEKKVEDTKRRLELVKATENAILMSIHQNIYPSGGPFGAQVLYAPTNGSKQLAETMQQILVSALNKQNRRAAAKVPNSVMLMNHITCPALLIECGFISNVTEEKLLMTDAYRLKIAAVIAAGYLNGKDSLANIESGGPDEREDSVLLH